MINDLENIIKEQAKNNRVIFLLLEYLIELWSINEDEEKIIKHFKKIGLTDEDIKALDIISMI